MRQASEVAGITKGAIKFCQAEVVVEWKKIRIYIYTSP